MDEKMYFIRLLMDDNHKKMKDEQELVSAFDRYYEMSGEQLKCLALIRGLTKTNKNVTHEDRSG